ncbi:MAG: hypothetical protein NVSMB29_06730 [Candidatus Dormibacteria bacterium]
MLLPWALPVVLAQWLAGHAVLRRRLSLLLTATLVPTAYLVLSDGVALRQGIWRIHPDRIIGAYLGNVPLEEALFFLLTDLMVVQSVILLNAPEMRGLASRLIRRRRAPRTN